jgi:O-antigen ligase
MPPVSGPRRPHVQERKPSAAAQWLFAIGLGGTLLASSLLVDPWGRDAFAAPKSLAAAFGLSLAACAAAWVGLSGGGHSRRWQSRRATAALAALGLLGVWLIVAALLCPLPRMSFHALRRAALLGLALPVGASTLFRRRKAVWLGIFLLGAAVQSILAILDRLRVLALFHFVRSDQRVVGAGLAGNPGHLGLYLALAIPASLALAIWSSRRTARAAFGALTLLLASGVAATTTLSGAVGTGVGCAAVLLWRWRRRAILPLAAAAVLGAVSLAAVPPLHRRVLEVIQAIDARDWNRALSSRGAPWMAAIEMIRSRPWTGYGPGTFGAEYVPERLAAEIRHHRRYLGQLVASSFGEAHNDYLQLAAEAGLPALALALAAAVAIFPRGRGTGVEEAILAGLFAGGAVGALTWFPFQLALTAVPLFLAAGRSIALSTEAPP